MNEKRGKNDCMIVKMREYEDASLKCLFIDIESNK